MTFKISFLIPRFFPDDTFNWKLRYKILPLQYSFSNYGFWSNIFKYIRIFRRSKIYFWFLNTFINSICFVKKLHLTIEKMLYMVWKTTIVNRKEQNTEVPTRIHRDIGRKCGISLKNMIYVFKLRSLFHKSKMFIMTTKNIFG